MLAFDGNYWGIMVVPIGILICFGPALLVWLKAEMKSDSPDKHKGDDKHH